MESLYNAIRDAVHEAGWVVKETQDSKGGVTFKVNRGICVASIDVYPDEESAAMLDEVGDEGHDVGRIHVYSMSVVNTWSVTRKDEELYAYDRMYEQRLPYNYDDKAFDAEGGELTNEEMHAVEVMIERLGG